ncbi:MAG: alpha/beta hydrolase [Bacteroidota bacterium]
MPTLLCSRPARGAFLAILIGVLAALSASAQDRTFAVEVTGSGPDVLLVPGLSSGGPVWDGTVARLSGEYRLHVVTLAGFAGEAPVEVSTQDGFLDVVRDDLAQYVRDLDAPAAVVGHSLGGFTALRVGLAAPEAVSHVVVVDALPFLAVMMDSTATEATAAAQGGPMKQMMALASPEQFRIQQQMALQGMITSPDSAAAYVDLHAASDIPSVAQAFYDMWTTDLRDDLASLTVPTLVLAAGAGYPPRTVEQVRAMYEAEYASLDGVRIVAVPGARHFIQLDQPDAMMERLRAFLREDVSAARR